MERPARPTVYVVAGRYDLVAIMKRAVIVARTLSAGSRPWSWRMAIALRTVWGWAKRQRPSEDGLPELLAAVRTFVTREAGR